MKAKTISALERRLDTIGWAASLAGILMNTTFIDQIRLNLEGQPGSLFLPLATVINCSLWTLYALLKQKTDWPIVACNALGVLMGSLTFVTAAGLPVSLPLA